MNEVVLDGLTLSLEDVERVASDLSVRVRLSDEAAERWNWLIRANPSMA